MIDRFLRAVLFGSRWLLAPLYLALVVCLVAVVVQGGVQIVDFAARFLTPGGGNRILVFVLGMVDLTLTGSLLVLVIFSGYENFVQKADPGAARSWPEWMAQIDFTGLKLKLMSSIVAISAVRLLEEMMDLDHATDRQLYWYLGIHMAFVVSTLLFAISDHFESHAGGQAPQNRH